MTFRTRQVRDNRPRSDAAQPARIAKTRLPFAAARRNKILTGSRAAGILVFRTNRSAISGKNAFSKFFHPQAFGIPQNDQRKVFENLEGLENSSIFSMVGKVINLPIRRFSAPNRAFPDIYLEGGGRRRPAKQGPVAFGVLPPGAEGALRVTEAPTRGASVSATVFDMARAGTALDDRGPHPAGCAGCVPPPWRGKGARLSGRRLRFGARQRARP